MWLWKRPGLPDSARRVRLFRLSIRRARHVLCETFYRGVCRLVFSPMAAERGLLLTQPLLQRRRKEVAAEVEAPYRDAVQSRH